MTLEEQERFDIESVRQWCKSAHVDDDDALEAFNSGRGVFDVDPYGVKLSSFFEKHRGLEPRTAPNGSYPAMLNGLVNNRPIYFGFKRS